MRQLYPDPSRPEIDLSLPDLRDTDLATCYAWPDGPTIRANMVATLDGRTTVSGRSGGLGCRADQRLLGLLRRISDVVLVGAGTVLAEGYTGLGLKWAEEPPPLAVVTSRALPAAHPIFTRTRTLPILLTTEQAAPDFDGFPARVITAGADRVDLPAAISALTGLGLTRVLCEGGPTLLDRLLAADLLDELCLTVSPRFVGAAELPLHAGTSDISWHLLSVHLDGDHLFQRYRRVTGAAGEPR